MAGSDDDEGAGRHRWVFAWAHPVLGRYEVLFDFDGGLVASLDLETRSLTLVAPTGLRILTPSVLPDLTLTAATLDLASGSVRIESEPELGPLEEQVISGLLQDELLSGLDPEGLLAQLASDDELILYQGSLVRVVAHPSAAVTLAFTRSRLQITLSQPIQLDFGKVLGTTRLERLRWNFAGGRLVAFVEGAPTLWDRVVENVAPALARFYFRRVAPPAMLEAGYDPATDKLLRKRLNHLLTHLFGAPADPAPAAPQAVAPVEPLRFAVDLGERVELVRTPEYVSLRSPSGVYLVAGGRQWARELRIFEIRYPFDGSPVRVAASVSIGEAALVGLTGILKRHVITPVADFFGSFPRDDHGRLVLPLDGPTLHVPDGRATATLLRGGAFELECRPRLLLRTGAVVKFAIERASYHPATREVDCLLRGTNCLARLFDRRARREVMAGLSQWLSDTLPESMQVDEYDFFGDPQQTEALEQLLGGPRSEEP